MDLKTISFAVDEKKVARITINRPEVRNALNLTVRKEIRQIIDSINNDDSIRVAIISGAGDKAFVGGADLNDFKEATPTMIYEYTHVLGQQLFTCVEDIRIPVIAMINGYCLGGGLELAMCCDIRIASTNARLGQPEINVGLLPGAGGTQRLPRLVGWGRAKELIYTGRIIEAAEAERIGLVDKVVPGDRLADEVTQLAESIAGKSSLLVGLAKRAINRGMYTDLGAGLAFERASFALCFASEDHAEGIAAFLEKRKPQFQGK